MRIKKHYRHGMTAIEVLAATVLASLMLGSVMGVMGSLARQQKVLRNKSGTPNWQQQFYDQLRWDLQNSRSYVVSQDRVRLEGFAGRDFATGRPTGQATEVEYYLLASEHDQYLVRREIHREARSNDAWRTEVVCRGVARLDFGPASVDQPSHATSRANRPENESLSTIPAKIATRLYTIGNDNPVIDQEFFIR